LSPLLHRINGFTHLNLTKLDMLSHLDTIQLGVAYRGADGRILPSMPADFRELEAVEVVYEQLPGWRQDISKAKSWDELPPNAKNYIRFADGVAERRQISRECVAEPCV
jgi:adenylosuccinate synthase